MATHADIEVGIIETPQKVSSDSVLEAGDDPFANRDGKTLLWRNVNMTLVRAEEENTKATKFPALSSLIDLTLLLSESAERKRKERERPQAPRQCLGRSPREADNCDHGPEWSGKDESLEHSCRSRRFKWTYLD
jgi:hypothetical protein